MNLNSPAALAVPRQCPFLAPGVGALLGAIGLALAALPARAARADWQQQLAAFEQRGFAVSVSSPPSRSHTPIDSHSPSSSYPRCAETNLFGLDLRSRHLIVICPRGNQTQTLLHEGWHAIQHRCLQGVPLLSQEQLLQGLSRRERREVDLLYRNSDWQREAEARVMAQQRPDLYFGWVDRVCARSWTRGSRPATDAAAPAVPGAGGTAGLVPVPAGAAVPAPPGITVN